MDILTASYEDPQASQRIPQSLVNTGFAVLTDHPIDYSLVQDVYAEWATFFNSQEKHTIDNSVEKRGNPGYFPISSENAKDSAIKDFKEFYHYYRWYNLPDSVSKKSIMLFEQLEALAVKLLTWIHLATPEHIRHQYSMPLWEMVNTSPTTLMRFLHYPPITNQEDYDNIVRAGEHEDICLLTLLPAATAQGLQVKDINGKWHDVDCNPKAIVINAGDMLQMASQGYYKSTTHRVVHPKDERAAISRYSIPLFLHPHPEVKLSKDHTQESYLQERLIELGLFSEDDVKAAHQKAA